MAGAYRPDVTAIPLGRPSPGASSNQPERQANGRPCGARRRRASLLFGFAPGGACRAADVAARAVRSYRTLSPLPRRLEPCGPRPGGLLSVALSLGFPPPDVIRRRIRMEPGLSSASKRRPSGRLAHAGIGGRRGGGQAESDAVVEQAGLSEPPAREPWPLSFIVASRELWDCAA